MLAVIASCLLANTTPIILTDHNYVLGTYSKGKWHQPIGLDALTETLSCNRFGVGKSMAPGTVTGFRKDELAEGVFDLKDGSTTDAQLIGRKPSFPRPARVENSTSKIYINAVNAYMRAAYHFSPKNTRIFQLVRSDLDGDGVNEVLICAGNCTDEALQRDPQGDLINKPGDYSAVLLRSVDRSGKIHMAELEAGVKLKAENILNMVRIEAVADVDGDHNMEVITSSRYYEGDSVQLWRYAHGKLKSLLSAGSGA